MTPNDHQVRVKVLTQACASTGSILENMTSEQLALPTPCSNWPVHEVINHVIGASRYFGDLAEWGSSPEGRTGPATPREISPRRSGPYSAHTGPRVSSPVTFDRLPARSRVTLCLQPWW